MNGYGPGPHNPDQRPLPWGFVQRFDQNYNTWCASVDPRWSNASTERDRLVFRYYVNTQTNPPRSSWAHPADEFPPQQQGGWQQGPPQGMSPGYGAPQGGYYPQQQQQSSGGMGTGTKVALAAGAGLVGGVLIADAIQDGQEDAYEEGT